MNINRIVSIENKIARIELIDSQRERVEVDFDLNNFSSSRDASEAIEKHFNDSIGRRGYDALEEAFKVQRIWDRLHAIFKRDFTGKGWARVLQALPNTFRVKKSVILSDRVMGHSFHNDDDGKLFAHQNKSYSHIVKFEFFPISERDAEEFKDGVHTYLSQEYHGYEKPMSEFLSESDAISELMKIDF